MPSPLLGKSAQTFRVYEAGCRSGKLPAWLRVYPRGIQATEMVRQWANLLQPPSLTTLLGPDKLLVWPAIALIRREVRARRDPPSIKTGRI